jgi:hypothetical protein
MAKNEFSSTKETAKKWEFDTADYFTLRLDEIRAVLTALIFTIGDNQSNERVTTDEVIVLTVQRVGQSLLELEKLSYDLDFSGDPTAPKIGQISLLLMWARAMTGMLEDKFDADGWKINFADHILVSYFSAVKRLTAEASAEAIKVHDQLFQKAA